MPIYAGFWQYSFNASYTLTHLRSPGNNLPKPPSSLITWLSTLPPTFPIAADPGKQIQKLL